MAVQFGLGDHSEPSQRQIRPLQPVVGTNMPHVRRSGARHRRAAAGPSGWRRWHAAAGRAARPACRAATSSRDRLDVRPGRGIERRRSPVRSPARWKRWRKGPRWAPRSAIRQPLSRSASSSAIQKPVTVAGVVCRKVASWCQPTSPPICGCLKRYIDCSSSGCDEAQAARQRGDLRLARDAVEHRIEIVQGMADLVQRWQRLSVASSSKKKRMAPPDSRK